MLDRNTLTEILREVAEIIRATAEPMSREEILGFFGHQDLDDHQKNLILEYLLKIQDEAIKEVKEETEAEKEESIDSKEEIAEAVREALDENDSVTHDYIGKFGGASVLLKKAPEGTGVIAGGPARAVIEMAGIKNIRTKSLGSNNKQNVVLATIEGLRQIKTPEEVAKLRGKSVEEIFG